MLFQSRKLERRMLLRMLLRITSPSSPRFSTQSHRVDEPCFLFFEGVVEPVFFPFESAFMHVSGLGEHDGPST